MPFFLLFLGVLWYVGGALALVPLAALVLLLPPGLLAQRRLRMYATGSMRESSLRNAMLVELGTGYRGTSRRCGRRTGSTIRWNHYAAVAGVGRSSGCGLTQRPVGVDPERPERRLCRDHLRRRAAR
ncbi:hypothetical protein QP185_19025 [Sphingomonas aerolata]|uniref:hypothetical protein n=1 Tax=Sphingomonas aerolata TaxID=185951 RepID=UPI002FE07D42